MRQVPGGDLADALGASSGGLISLVGGGGKTTALYRLVGEWRGRGLRAFAATTTRIAVPEPGEPELRLAETWEALHHVVQTRSKHPVVLGRRVLSEGKVEGLPPEWCSRIFAEGLAKALAVEADGAARLPVKAPAPWEPVVPAATTVFVAVVGLSCLGKPLDGNNAFRPARVGEAAGLSWGEAIGTGSLVRLLRAPQGLAKGCPPGAAAVALLNQADGPKGVADARAVAQGLLEPGSLYDRVVAASLRTEPPVRAVWLR
ncbi:MAG: selenium cofactor biosynthesis protein YqeC [Deferrisomatales bacterium]